MAREYGPATRYAALSPLQKTCRQSKTTCRFHYHRVQPNKTFRFVLLQPGLKNDRVTVARSFAFLSACSKHEVCRRTANMFTSMFLRRICTHWKNLCNTFLAKKSPSHHKKRVRQPVAPSVSARPPRRIRSTRPVARPYTRPDSATNHGDLLRTPCRRCAGPDRSPVGKGRPRARPPIGKRPIHGAPQRQPSGPSSPEQGFIWCSRAAAGNRQSA